jgi:uncharacterized membrane protein
VSRLRHPIDEKDKQSPITEQEYLVLIVVNLILFSIWLLFLADLCTRNHVMKGSVFSLSRLPVKSLNIREQWREILVSSGDWLLAKDRRSALAIGDR